MEETVPELTRINKTAEPKGPTAPFSSVCNEFVSDSYTSISAANAPRIKHKHVASRIARSRGSTRSTDSGFWAMSPPQIVHPSPINTPRPRSDYGNQEEDRRSGNVASVGTRTRWCQCTFTSIFSSDEGAQICIRSTPGIMSLFGTNATVLDATTRWKLSAHPIEGDKSRESPQNRASWL